MAEPRAGVFVQALLVGLGALAAGSAWAQGSVEARTHDLATRLRCVVCQNQTLAESQSPIAVELRQQVHDQLAAGATESQVEAFLVERYGDFVLYKPPVKPLTWLLWSGPAWMLVAGAVVFWRRLRRPPAAGEGA